MRVFEILIQLFIGPRVFPLLFKQCSNLHVNRLFFSFSVCEYNRRSKQNEVVQRCKINTYTNDVRNYAQ